MRVVGIDGCRKGWVGIVLTAASLECVFGASIGELMSGLADIDGIGIDMPIGIPDTGRRSADQLAKAALRRRANSLFFTPVRAALLAEPFAAANAQSVLLTGQGISQQAYRLRAKIFEIEEWLPSSPAPVWEVHPELSFQVAKGAELAHSKKSWAGAEERRRILGDHGLVLQGALPPGGAQAGVDDVLDAAIVAWSARRLVSGLGVSYPDPPVQGPTGRQVAIWA